MNELQKKVLMFLLKELDKMTSDWSCDETEIPDLTEEDRRNLTIMLYSHWNELEEWNGHANKEFGIGSLTDLAQYWLTGKKGEKNE